MRVAFDTNVLVDYLRGLEDARVELGRHREWTVSLVTWMELLVGAHDEEEEVVIRAFLGRFEVADIDRRTAEEAVRLRRSRRMRLPDAIVWATARVRQAVLVTRNTKDFPADDLGIRVPYSV